jgi:hypothetical protein
MAKRKTEAGAAESFDADLLGTSAEGARAAVVKAAEKGGQLVEAWVDAKNAAAVAAVAEDDAAPAPARKAARRGINVLKARGVVVPERTHIARIAGDAVEGYEAWFLPPDGSGAAIAVIAARYKSGKLRAIHTILRDGAGLLEVRALELSRSQLKTTFDETAKRMGYAPTPVPVEWARARVAAARSENAKSGAILPLGLDSHADILGPAPDKTPPHPIDEAHLEPAPSAVETSANLHGEPEFGPWLPARQALQELLMDVGQKLSAGAKEPQPDQKNVDVAISSSIDAATDRFFSPEIRERISDRMRDAAISILAREGRPRAAEVIATAAAVKAAGLITSPPHEIPFLRGFFQKALAMLAAQSDGQLSIPIPDGATEVASPAELAVEKALPGEKVSSGGIILP